MAMVRRMQDEQHLGGLFLGVLQRPTSVPTALTVALVAAATLVSAISATCLAALFMLSKAEVAAAIGRLDGVNRNV
jgi:hypothetical protein